MIGLPLSGFTKKRLSPKEVSWNEVVYEDKVPVYSGWSKGSWCSPRQSTPCGGNTCNLHRRNSAKRKRKRPKSKENNGQKDEPVNEQKRRAVILKRLFVLPYSGVRIETRLGINSPHSVPGGNGEMLGVPYRALSFYVIHMP